MTCHRLGAWKQMFQISDIGPLGREAKMHLGPSFFGFAIFLWWVSRLEVSVTVKDIEKRNPVGGHLGRNLIGRSAFDGNEKQVFEQVLGKLGMTRFLGSRLRGQSKSEAW